LGYGTGTTWCKSTESGLDRNLIDSIKLAISLGYTHLDGADSYNNEAELGVAIKESGVPRDSLFVTTKVMDSTSDIQGAIDTSLKKLQLDSVDLYLIHSPYFGKSPEDLQRAWAIMEEVQKSGKAKSIGLSNFLTDHIEAVLKTAQVVPSINQIEYHPYLQHKNLVPLLKKHGIAVSAYGPLTAVTKAKPGPVDQTIEKLAKKYDATEGEVALRWVMDQGLIPITTTGKASRMKEYLGVVKFQLTPEEVKEISTVGEKKHFRGFWKMKFDPDDRS
jgi:diketogulonate reductase-like aldo/keto reductase